MARGAWSWIEQHGRITSEDPGDRRFGHLGEGVSIGFPVGSLYGEPWMEIGDGTLIGCQVTLTAGMLPNTDLGPDPVLRIGKGCLVGRGSHIVAHESVTIGDQVFIAPHAYITDQNHTYTDPDHAIGCQPPHNRPVRIGDGCWIGAAAVVLPGAQLGRNVAVAAGSVVRGDFPDHCLIGGVPARILRRYTPGTGWSRSASRHTAKEASVSIANPTRTPDMINIMIVGDSISHGSSGDWTWRYRFWKHLREHDVSVDLVGPKNTLDNIRTEETGDDDSTYADPEFDPDHDAQWGRPYVTEKEEIEAKVSAHQPDHLLVLLGINDLFWYGVEPPQFEENLREFIARARNGSTGLSIVLGTVLQCQKAVDEPEFGARVDATNERIRAVAKDLDSTTSPVTVAETAAEFLAGDHTWDGTHPNPNGELRIAAAFADAMASRFGIGARYPRPYPDVAPIVPEAKAKLD
ncbi:putative sugar acetyltransferase [Streptomyces formicae]|uniref:Putative sugar acetyltransferase n=1 Tax=Streptomyces formicae TaxID=1616117 RepID=A0A291Q2C8_9ACTN|nr:putative sugar acetyltransferase [Streptomyces formicae]